MSSTHSAAVCRTSIVLLSVVVWPGCSSPAPSTAPLPGPTAGSSAGQPAPTGSSPESDSGSPPTGPAVAWPTGQTGTIAGTFTFDGADIPQPTIVPNTTDPAACGAEMSKNDVVISPSTRGVRWVIVAVTGLQPPAGYVPPPDSLVIDNRKCQFDPHAAAITVGSTVVAQNSDDIWHSTHYYGQPMNDNPALPARGALHKTRARRPGFVNVKCDKHGWMQAFIRVDPHPFHAVSDPDGQFKISGVPAGEYQLDVFHEFLGKETIPVTVAPNQATTLKLRYSAADDAASGYKLTVSAPSEKGATK
jgi:hypothetical protein